MLSIRTHGAVTLALVFLLVGCSSGPTQTGPAVPGDGEPETNQPPPASEGVSRVTATEILYPEALKSTFGPSSQALIAQLNGRAALQNNSQENFSRDPFPVWDLYTLEQYRQRPSDGRTYLGWYRQGLLDDVDGEVSSDGTITYQFSSDATRGFLSINDDGEDAKVWVERAEADGTYRLSGFDTATGWSIDFHHTYCLANNDAEPDCDRATPEEDFSFGLFGARGVGNDLEIFYLSQSVGSFGVPGGTPENPNLVEFPTAQTFIARGNDEMSFVRYAYRTFFGDDPTQRIDDLKHYPVDTIWDVFAVAEEGGGQMLFHRQHVGSNDYVPFDNETWDHHAVALRYLVLSSSDQDVALHVDFADELVQIIDGSTDTPTIVGALVTDFGYSCGPTADFSGWGRPPPGEEGRCPLLSHSPRAALPADLVYSLPEGITASSVFQYGLDTVEQLADFDLRLRNPFTEDSRLPTLIDDEFFRQAVTPSRWAEVWNHTAFASEADPD